MNDIKERDVYRFHYTPTEQSKRFMPDHCFDGQLVAFLWDSDRTDSIRLQDSYWLYQFKPGGSGKIFTPEQAAQQGTLQFVCNLDDVDIVNKYDTQYYADGDVFNLSYQHGCYPYFAVRKGAKRNAEKMLVVLAQQEQEQRSNLSNAANALQRIASARQRIQDGHIDEVYLP